MSRASHISAGLEGWRAIITNCLRGGDLVCMEGGGGVVVSTQTNDEDLKIAVNIMATGYDEDNDSID